MKLFRNRKGAALVEYGLLVAGVALVAAAAVSIFGHKTNDMLAVTAGVLPGVHAGDNNPIVSGRIIETTSSTDVSNANGDGGIIVDLKDILANSNTSRVKNNYGFENKVVEELVLDTN